MSNPQEEDIYSAILQKVAWKEVHGPQLGRGMQLGGAEGRNEKKVQTIGFHKGEGKQSFARTTPEAVNKQVDEVTKEHILGTVTQKSPSQ